MSETVKEMRPNGETAEAKVFFFIREGWQVPGRLIPCMAGTS